MPVSAVRQFLVALSSRARHAPSRSRVAGILLLLAPFLAGFGPPIMTDGRAASVRLAPADIAAIAAAARPPRVTAAAALVVDIDSGATLYAKSPNVALPPASTAKLMTALLVLQEASPDASVIISQNAASIGGSTMWLEAGERFTVEQLLYGLLLPSGNDAAVALAEYVAGSEASFVAKMNGSARQMGLSASRFANPHGLDAAGQVMSASDLLALTRVALDYPLFRTIIATRSITVGGRLLTNTNELLGVRVEVDGVKTGTTDEGGQCLVASATRNGHRLLAVVLGSGDRYADMAALLDFAENGWEWQRSGLPDNALAWWRDVDGRSYRLRSVATSDIFVPAWQAVLLQPVRVLTDTAAMTSTLPVGQLRWMMGDQALATVPLSVWQGP
jgi:serine-type D-Ala-D-Ala carboxypeptidase (penicillin-binding protein 5/6)